MGRVTITDAGAETRYNDGIDCLHTEWTTSHLLLREYLADESSQELRIPRAQLPALLARLRTLCASPAPGSWECHGWGLLYHEFELRLTPPTERRREFVSTLDCTGFQAALPLWRAIAEEVERVLLQIAAPTQAHTTLAETIAAPRG